MMLLMVVRFLAKAIYLKFLNFLSKGFAQSIQGSLPPDTAGLRETFFSKPLLLFVPLFVKKKSFELGPCSEATIYNVFSLWRKKRAEGSLKSKIKLVSASL